MKMRTYKCPDCDFSTTNRPSVYTHKMSIHLKIKHTCEECGQEFTSKHAMNNHVDRVHKGIINHYSCEECEKVYREKSDLQRHVRIIHKGVRYSCQICGIEYDHSKDNQNYC